MGRTSIVEIEIIHLLKQNMKNHTWVIETFYSFAIWEIKTITIRIGLHSWFRFVSIILKFITFHSTRILIICDSVVSQKKNHFFWYKIKQWIELFQYLLTNNWNNEWNVTLTSITVLSINVLYYVLEQNKFYIRGGDTVAEPCRSS